LLSAGLAAALALRAGVAAADEVYLKGGGQLSGKIVSRTAATIEVDVGAGKIGVPASSVLRVEEGRSPLHEFEERAGALAAGDVEGWIALGEWATGQGLSTQAREAYHRALAVSPTDPRANLALGNVLLDGRWVSEADAYRAKGFVEFEGEWVTAAEQQAILRERAAEEQRERQRADAEARVREAEARAEEAEARAREAEAQAAEPLEGLPLWYGWGAGPGYWPSGPVVVPPVAPSRPVRPRPVPR
jgi:hypothetical protein